MNDDLHALQLGLACQQAAWRQAPWPSHAERCERLARLAALLDQHETALCEAVAADFGQRSTTTTHLTELLLLRRALRHTRRHLARWMRPQRAPVGLTLLPSRARVVCQPLGVVGIMGAWNYPLLLVLGPLIGALAAGNRALLKPSELTPRTAGLLQQVMAHHFDPGEVSVITGDARVAAAFAAAPFDHLVFTGSTATGRRVAAAAAHQLTPLTLELGGKAPAIIDRTADLDLAARRIVWGKLLNAGQSCVAPDHVLLPPGLVEPFAAAAQAAARTQYPSGLAEPDYTAIINDVHWQRLQELLDDATMHGARLQPLVPGVSDPQRRLMLPQLVLGAHDGMRLMQEEIFGPLLPLVEVDSDAALFERLDSGARPLSLSWFGRNRAVQRAIEQRTVSGALLINDTMAHLGVEDLPFGGAGASGFGHYHGEYGFRRFSQQKAVFQSFGWSAVSWLHPPWTAGTRRLIHWLERYLD